MQSLISRVIRERAAVACVVLKCIVLAALAWFFAGDLRAEEAKGGRVRMNQIQVIGTHNSYHIEPTAAVREMIASVGEKLVQSIAYTHRPLTEQFDRLGVRQIELDLYADPEGGLYATPRARQLLEGDGKDAEPEHDPKGVLKKPGLKILHMPDFDYRTTVLRFREALEEIGRWSSTHPRHVPIMVLLELKEEGVPLGIKPPAFTTREFDEMEREILEMIPRRKILAPDDVRGDAATLRQAIVERGWPFLDDVRGRVMFALDNGGRIRDAYVEGHPSLRGRLLFASVDEQDPGAAWFKINDPVGEFDRIRRLVGEGFMVRTRADSGTWQARSNDGSQRERALASGAQFVSTDYPEPNKAFSPYCVRFLGGVVARANPVNGEKGLEGEDLEGLKAAKR